MKRDVYAIRDQLVGFLPPTLADNDDAAIRQFSILINHDTGTLLASTPQYFDLYKIGEYDTEDGKMIPLKDKQLLVTGLSVVKGEKDG